MRVADVFHPATRAVLSGLALSKLTASELATVLADPDFSAAAGDQHEDYEAGILGELQARAERGDPIAQRAMAGYVEDGVLCAGAAR